MDYEKLPTIDYRTFNRKSDKVQKLIRQSLQIINALGIPIDDLTERQKEKMAMAFLAVGDVKTSAGWKKIKDSNNEYSLTTREIIAYENKYFEENISSGSYDDIKRKDLARLLLAMIVVNSKLACVLAILTVCTIAYARQTGHTAGATDIFAGGIAAMVAKIPGMAGLENVLYMLPILTYSAFCLTSLDTATRLARFMFQEFWLEPGQTPADVEEGNHAGPENYGGILHGYMVSWM